MPTARALRLHLKEVVYQTNLERQGPSVHTPEMANSQLKTNGPCDLAKDGLFGPGVQCSQFDFTLTFEQAIFGVGISSIYLICFLIRLGQLHGQSIKTLQSIAFPAKLVRACRSGIFR
jgi:hypothetical protein